MNQTLGFCILNYLINYMTREHVFSVRVIRKKNELNKVNKPVGIFHNDLQEGNCHALHWKI